LLHRAWFNKLWRLIKPLVLWTVEILVLILLHLCFTSINRYLNECDLTQYLVSWCSIGSERTYHNTGSSFVIV
jgi:hypothetical protein